MYTKYKMEKTFTIIKDETSYKTAQFNLKRKGYQN